MSVVSFGSAPKIACLELSLTLLSILLLASSGTDVTDYDSSIKGLDDESAPLSEEDRPENISTVDLPREPLLLILSSGILSQHFDIECSLKQLGLNVKLVRLSIPKGLSCLKSKNDSNMYLWHELMLAWHNEITALLNELQSPSSISILTCTHKL